MILKTQADDPMQELMLHNFWLLSCRYSKLEVRSKCHTKVDIQPKNVAYYYFLCFLINPESNGWIGFFSV